MMDIKEEILTFINREEETGALLITGKWGSGKSYYIKGLAKELNDNKREYLCVISLFGIDSVASLVKAVKECYLEANSTIFTKTARKIGKVVGKTVDSGLKVAEAATGGNVAVSAAQKGFSSVLSLGLLDFISVKNYIGRGKLKRKFVLVFDDLERCKISMIDLLGAINEYCENRNIKTIILADESKILRNEASLKKVTWKDDEKEKEISIAEQLKSAENYSEFKEKVIFQTLEFDVAYSKIIGAMISSYKESVSGYVNFLHCNADIIKQVFRESGYNNLRSIKTILANFERVYCAINEAEVPQEYTVKILYNFCIVSFETKPKIQSSKGDCGIDEIVEKYTSGIGNTNRFKEKYDGEGISIYSLQQWIETGRYEEKAVISEIKNIFSPKQITDKIKVLHWSIFDLDYSTTEKGLKEALRDAYDGKLDGMDYVGLIDRLQYYRLYEFPIDFVDYKKLSEGIDKYEERLKRDGINKNDNIIIPYQIMQRANKDTIPLIEKLEYIGHNCIVWAAKLKFMRAIQSKERRFYALDVHWLEAFDDELLTAFMREYYEANNAQKREMSQYLLNLDFIYEFDFSNTSNQLEKEMKGSAIKTSIANFGKLQEEVKSQAEHETDFITKMILNEFSGNIAEKIQQLKDGLEKITKVNNDNN